MIRLFAALAMLLGFSAPAIAQIDQQPKVHARLIAEQGEVAPGGTVSVALEEIIRPGWHTYWINPGDAGAPTTLAWTLPAGWSAGAIQWPYPKRLPVGQLMDYGYEGKVWLLASLTAPADAKPDTNVVLHAHATWLVCKDVCIPEETDLSLPLTVSASPSPPYATDEADFAAARAELPIASPWPVSFHVGDSLDLLVAAPAMAKAEPKDVAFFPLRDDVLNAPAPQRLGTAEEGIVLRLTPTKKAAALKTLDGDLVVTSRDGSVQAFAVSATPGAMPQASFTQASGGLSLPLALAFAFLGGLILNLMPCVLPILAMKALTVASHAKASRSVAMRESLAYGIGAVASFLALGGAVVALRAGGAAIGWGFQLQEPAAVAGFALLMFAVGLNLSGAFEIAQGITAGDTLARRGGSLGAYFTGVLAVAVAAPCTAPFMAAALGFALSQSAGMALGVFAALGVGFALPFTAIGFSPRLLSLIPKPGSWMIRFRELLAFPMYGAAAWLAWVLSEEAGSQGLIAVFVGALALGFAAYAWSVSRDAKSHWRRTGAVAAVVALAVVAASVVYADGGVPRSAAAPGAAGPLAAQAYSPERLAALRAQNRAVFVDATAAWCITCLVNEKVAFSNADVQAAFAKKRIAYLVADWTNRDAAITALLQAHDRSGVPLYLYYAPGAGQPTVLPQVLTPGEVLDAIGGKS